MERREGKLRCPTVDSCKHIFCSSYETSSFQDTSNQARFKLQELKNSKHNPWHVALWSETFGGVRARSPPPPCPLQPNSDASIPSNPFTPFTRCIDLYTSEASGGGGGGGIGGAACGATKHSFNGYLGIKFLFPSLNPSFRIGARTPCVLISHNSLGSASKRERRRRVRVPDRPKRTGEKSFV